VSKTTISTITDRVLDGMVEWQNRPLDSVYPVVFIDCIVRHEALHDRVGVGDLHRCSVAVGQ
jgi:transposase-like protein